MQTLKELQVEVKKDIEISLVDDDYCIDIINKGNLVRGYGLWLAKEIVHKDSNTGWEDFCKRIDITKRGANYQIEFYEAKSGTTVPDSLPNKEGTFRALPSGTVQEKEEFFKEVKELTHKEEPTAQDIEIVSVINGRAIKDEKLKERIQDAMNESSNTVRTAFVKNKKTAGIKKVVEAIEAGEEDKLITELISGADKKPKPKNMVDCREQNKIIREENKSLKEENKKLLEKLDGFDLFEKFSSRVGNLWRISHDIDDERKINDKILSRYTPAIRAAIEMLEVEMNTETSFEMIKKSYRDKARKHHPDIGGDEQAFVKLNESYELLKGMYNGK